MSTIGVWVVAPLDDIDVADVRHRFPEAADSYGRVPERSAELTWWAGTSASEPFFVPCVDSPGRRCCTDAAIRLSELVSDQVWSETHEELKDALMALLPNDGAGLFCATSSRADPSAALAYAIGAQSMLRMSGYFGDFLLTSDQLRDVLPDIEVTLSVPEQRRPEITARIMDWMTVIGDAPNHDAVELVDGPLRVFRNAAMTGCGVVGLARRY